uniref:BACK domain-containing protein n=1 Tax=Mesocestoides corti TaxID=53468 RepID=A0A5K3G2I7_MESCO
MTDIVEAVVVFAYTGSIEISMDNAVRLFLLASNLGSRTITSWCAEFLRPRVSKENVEQIWSVANATKNTQMIDICVPVIAAHFDSITTQVTFHSTTELDSLSSLLGDDRLVGVAEAAKLRTIAKWFEGNSTANKENVTAFVDKDDDSRDATFKDLVGAVALRKITSGDFAEFCMSDCWINLQREFRDLISNAWKEARRIRPFQDYLIALMNHPPYVLFICNEVTFATSKWKEIEKKIIASADEVLPTVDVNFRHTLPSRRGCAVVVLNDSIYMIGGRNEKREVSRLVDRVDPFDGSVSSSTPMVQARRSCSAAADDAVKGQQLFVFGGHDGDTQISSCEKFDPATNRWTSLPDMPTRRENSGAVGVPGVGVVVVGGYIYGRGTLDTAELLSCSTEDNGVENWSWRQLAPMLKRRSFPGVANFRGRVVVADRDNRIECLRLPADDSNPGQWTQLHALKKGLPEIGSPVVLNERLLLADCHGNVHEFFPASESEPLTLETFTWKPIFTIQNVSIARLLVLRKRC